MTIDDFLKIWFRSLTCAPGGESEDILGNAQPETILRGDHHLVDWGRPQPCQPHSPINNIDLDIRGIFYTISFCLYNIYFTSYVLVSTFVGENSGRSSLTSTWLQSDCPRRRKLIKNLKLRTKSDWDLWLLPVYLETRALDWVLQMRL